MSEFSRRQFMALAGSAAAGVWLTANAERNSRGGSPRCPGDEIRDVDARDAIEIEAATAQIVPTDATPGAKEARVVHFIDKALSTFAKDQRPASSRRQKSSAHAPPRCSVARSRSRRCRRRNRSPFSRRMEKEKPQLFRRCASARSRACSRIRNGAATTRRPAGAGSASTTGSRGHRPSAGTTAMAEHTHRAARAAAADDRPIPARRRGRFRRRRIGRGGRRRRQGVVHGRIPRRRARAGSVAHGTRLRARRDQDLPTERAVDRLDGPAEHVPQDGEGQGGEQPALVYARGVGGTSVHFSANFWRFREIDFKEASVKGTLAGTGFMDWPITYQDLEPYYTKVDWEVGVAGAPGPFDPPRSRPYPDATASAEVDRRAARAGARTSSATSHSPRRWPSRRSHTTAGRSACSVASARASAAKCEQNRARSSPSFRKRWPPDAARSARTRYARKIETDAQGARHRREILRRGQEGGLPAREGRGRLRERRRDAAAVAQLELEPVPARSRQLERRGRQVSDAERRRARGRRVRSRGERLQGHRRDARRVGSVRARSRSSGWSAAVDSTIDSTSRRSNSR